MDIGCDIVVSPPWTSAASARLKLPASTITVASIFNGVSNFIRPPVIVIKIGAIAAAGKFRLP
jgi:hypothetical protein